VNNDLVDGYATAVLAVAAAEGCLEQVGDELFGFARAMEGSDRLRQALTDQSIPADRRQALVEELLGPRALPTVTALASFIVGAGRAHDLDAIVERVVERSAAERQHVVAEVRSASVLDASQRERLATALSAAMGKQVEVKAIVDPAVLGGLVARVGDTVIDGTVRHRLEQLREAL